MKTFRIKDTGLTEVGGTESFTKVTYGTDNWMPLQSFTLNAEFNTLNNNNEGKDSSSGTFDFIRNSVTGVISPRFTVRGYLKSTDTTIINKLVSMGRTIGIKRISGGIGVIDALPEALTDTYKYISVIITNITFSENVSDTDELIGVTIQLKQV